MFEDLYVKSESQLLDEDFIGSYALLLHRNLLGTFLIPGPHQEPTWGNKSPFILNNPQLVNLALALGKYQIASLIIDEVIKRRPRGFDLVPNYAGQQYPLPPTDSEDFPDDMASYLPLEWIEHQFVRLSLIRDGQPANDYLGAPPMCICVLTHDHECFDTLIKYKYKPGITSNQTYVLEPVLLAANTNAYDLIPKLIEIGAPFDMSERQHILTATSPYLSACTRGHVEFVQHMLRMGYEIDEQHQKHGDTCLHAAAMAGHTPLVHFLLEKGADATIINEDDGQSAYSLSVQYHHRHIQAMIAESLLKERLPLPKPPTLNQRLKDLDRQDDIAKYLQGIIDRTGVTKQELLSNMDSAPYDPYYDFDGTYDPTEHLGNVERSIAADRISQNGAVQFLVELDGITYTSGTYTYKEKLQEYIEKEQRVIDEKKAQNAREHDELIKLVEESISKKLILDKETEAHKNQMPPEVAKLNDKKQNQNNEPILYNLDENNIINSISSTKLYSQYQQNVHNTTKSNMKSNTKHDEL